MGHCIFMKKRKSILQLLCLRQMGIGDARTLSHQAARGLYTGHTPLVAVLNTRVNSAGFDCSSEMICFVKNISNVSCLCLMKINAREDNNMGPVIQVALDSFNCPGKNIGVLLIEGAYSFFSENIPSCDLEPTVLVLKQSHLLRFQASNGVGLSKYDLSFVGMKMITWDLGEEDDLLIIQSAKQVINSSFKAAFVVFQMQPFSFLCCLLITQNSFNNPNPSLYGIVTVNSSIELNGTYLSVSTNKGYTLLFNIRAHVRGAGHGEVMQEVSCLPCLLVLPGKFSLMTMEHHSGDFTMLFGNEPHSMYLSTVGSLIEYIKNDGCVDQAHVLNNEPTSTSLCQKSTKNSRSCKQKQNLMIQSCGKELKWEEEDCNFICSCSASSFPGEFNRIIVKEPGSLRVYELPHRSQWNKDSLLFDNLLLRCGAQKKKSSSALEDFTKYGRRIQRPPKYRPHHLSNNYFYSYSPELNLVSVLSVQRLATTFLLSNISFYDVYSLSLLRNLNLSIKVNLGGQDPTGLAVTFCEGIILIDLITYNFHHLLAFRLGSASDSNIELDLLDKFADQDSEESDSS